MNTFRNSNEKFQGATIVYHNGSDDILYRTYNDSTAEFSDPISCDEAMDLASKGMLLLATTSNDTIFTPSLVYEESIDDSDILYAVIVYITGVEEEAPVMATAYSKEYPGA